MKNSAWSPVSVHARRHARHYAEISQYTIGLMGVLPDPDVVLRKAGKGTHALRDLLTDSHLSSVWDVRNSSVVTHNYVIVGSDRRALDLCQQHLDRWDVYSIARAVLQSVAYGVQPFELMWEEIAGQWMIQDIIAKPADWFVWDIRSHAWKLRKGWTAYRRVPPLRFKFVANNPTFQNPYGEKLFSRIFWPVTLKRSGIQWWARCLEKFGSPYLIGKHPSNATADDKARLLHALDEMIGSSVGIMSNDDALETIDSTQRAGSTAAHKQFVETMNAEVSKAILGQTLTTELAGSAGSRAAAVVHDHVRSDIASRDRRSVESFFNDIFKLLVETNLGDAVDVPRFNYEVPESLHNDRVDRDAKIFAMLKKRASTAYAERYGITDEMIGDDIVSSSGMLERTRGMQTFVREQEENFDETKKYDKRYERSVFGLFDKFLRRRTAHNDRYVDAIVAQHQDRIKNAVNFDDAMKAVMELAPDVSVESVARAIEEMRWIACNVGGGNG